jgi:hypothetical protein
MCTVLCRPGGCGPEVQEPGEGGPRPRRRQQQESAQENRRLSVQE